jgi:hypothetical protein
MLSSISVPAPGQLRTFNFAIDLLGASLQPPAVCPACSACPVRSSESYYADAGRSMPSFFMRTAAWSGSCLAGVYKIAKAFCDRRPRLPAAGWVQPQRLSQQGSHLLIGKTPKLETEQDQRAEQCLHGCILALAGFPNEIGRQKRRAFEGADLPSSESVWTARSTMTLFERA